MKIILSKQYKKSQIGPVYEELMEQQVAREEAARKRLRDLENPSKKRSKLRPQRKSIFDPLELNQRAQEIETNTTTKFDKMWQDVIGKLKSQTPS